MKARRNDIGKAEKKIKEKEKSAGDDQRINWIIKAAKDLQQRVHIGQEMLKEILKDRAQVWTHLKETDEEGRKIREEWEEKREADQQGRIEERLEEAERVIGRCDEAGEKLGRDVG